MIAAALKPGALVWAADKRGTLRLAKVVDGAPIQEREERVEFLVLLWKRNRGRWAITPAPWLIARELTVEERRHFPGDYEVPTVTPIGNLRDLLEGGMCSTDHRRKAVG